MAEYVSTPQSHCQWGGARGDITPPEGIYHRMWGAATHDRAAGIHRPLTATVMVFDDKSQTGDRHAWVALDHCLLGVEEFFKDPSK